MGAPFYRLEESPGEVYLDRDLYLQVPGDFDAPSHWYMETRSIKGEYKPLTLRFQRSASAYDDFVSYGSLNFVSDRLRNLASGSGDVNAEFLPVTTLAKNRNPIDLNPYWCVHFLETPTCIDYENSDIELWSTRSQLIKTIRRLKLDATKVGARSLFAPLGLGMIFVCAALAEQIRTAKLRVGLTPLERIRLGAGAYATKPSRLH
jgi:uncharacterized protein DUF1629